GAAATTTATIAATATALPVIAAVAATTRMAAAVVTGECAHRASRGCFRNPSASATQFARRRDSPRLGKLQTLAGNL
ncbi:hypothetical protein P5V15_011820, partial [Pogonomyrmex californicus]